MFDVNYSFVSLSKGGKMVEKDKLPNLSKHKRADFKHSKTKGPLSHIVKIKI